ncbi:hypothetical protein TNCV_4208751 [Trichonephila clavipes]|nr:hypothetical protein TNCV_4208751 [Trichonephila clavipes]
MSSGLYHMRRSIGVDVVSLLARRASNDCDANTSLYRKNMVNETLKEDVTRLECPEFSIDLNSIEQAWAYVDVR